MPGIAGIISKAGLKEENALAVRRMVGCMMHEPSYRFGTYGNDFLGVWVGWVSHDGAFADCMPSWNEEKNVCLIFTGEVFTETDEVGWLRARGHDCNPDDAGFLVHLYEEMGTGFIARLNGWFSGLVIDLRRGEVILFNDRYGLSRINYHEKGDFFYFSSEAKSLLRVLPELRALDPRGLGEKFGCGCVLQNRTIFPGIRLVPGGAMWSFSRGGIAKQSYFAPQEWEEQPELGENDFYERLRETFDRFLPKYFAGRKRVAMSLTGGLDGRMIMAWSRLKPGVLPCYSFGSHYHDTTDARLARRVAHACDQPHETIIVDQGFCRDFPTLAEKAVRVSDGTMDVTGAVELYINRLAGRIAPVRMTGNYGSEILRSGVAFRPQQPNGRVYAREFAEMVGRAAATYAEESKCHGVSFIAFKQVPWHHYSRLSVEASQLTVRSPYLDNELVRLMYRAPAALLRSRDVSLRIIRDGNPRLSRLPTDRGVRWRGTSRLPQWRHYYEEFMFKAEYAYDYGMPQWLARIDQLLSPFHPERLFLGRHKFYHFRVWYRDLLADYIKEVLLDPRAKARPYLRPGSLEEIVLLHTRGVENHTLDIHRLLTAELLQRQLIEGEG